jgi:hypothetical protein
MYCLENTERSIEEFAATRQMKCATILYMFMQEHYSSSLLALSATWYNADLAVAQAPTDLVTRLAAQPVPGLALRLLEHDALQGGELRGGAPIVRTGLNHPRTGVRG